MEELQYHKILELLGISKNIMTPILAFVIAILFTSYCIPIIIRVSKFKNLVADLNERSSHTDIVPNLGGIAIFATICVVGSIFASGMFVNFRFLFASYVLLFFIGIKDDVLIISPYKKLVVQIIAALLMTIGSNLRIYSLMGLFGIYELNYFISVAITIFIYIALINAYNLIDGIDGLAASVAIVALTGFLYTFVRLSSLKFSVLNLNDVDLALMCIVLIGALVAFLYFNFSHKKKIFMGDTGSMVIGFTLAFMAVRFINLCNSEQVDLDTGSVVALALLIVPVVDTLSVFLIRIAKKTSPFSADKNHLHHRLLRLGLSHIQTTLLIVVYNLLIIGLTYYFRLINVTLLFILILFVSIIFSLIPIFLDVKKTKSIKNEN